MIMNMLAAVESGVEWIGGWGVGLAIVGTALGCALIVIGAARGIGTIAGKAVESIARQPEAGGRIFTSMVIAAALIEGFTFFAIVVCMLGLSKLEALLEMCVRGA